MDTRETPQRSVWVVFTGLMLVMLMAALDQTIVSTALPTIVGDLGGLNHISWVVTAYLLAQTAVMPVYGKLGDLLGRKIVLQFALTLFLVGSALCGLSTTLFELVAFRAIQGLGGGGLMVGAMAAIGDVVTPRERGRYQGLFGAVFGLASVIGPLLGGFFTSSLSWRWIFYVNLPVGVMAFTVLAATLPSVKAKVHVRIDYVGAAVLAAALIAIVLMCTLGGVDYRWLSPVIIGLGVLAIALVCVFLLVEGRAAEPVMPRHLFKNRVFNVTSAVGFVVGFALFGSVTYLPLFLQVVNGSSPTGSGLQILPLMAGLLITSIGSGQTITRTGIYKPFPIVGTFVMIIGLALLSTMDAGTSRLLSSLFMFILGLGLGMVMQVLVLAVQNAVDFSDLGVATSGATLFRSIGGSVGTAILGSIFSGRLKTNLRVNLASNPATSKLSASQLKAIATASSNPKSLKTLPPAVHHVYVSSYANALDRVFVVAAIVAAAAFLMSWLLEQRPLRDTAQASAGLSETFAAPKPADSLAELSRALSVLVGRDGRRRLVEQLAERAGVDLSAAAAWILARMSREPGANVEELCETWDVPLERGRAGLRELVQKGMLVPTSTQSEPAPVPTSTQSEPAPVAGSREVDTAPSSEPRYEITDLGRETAERLVTERRATFARLLDGWEPEENTELAALLTRFAHEMAAQPDLAVTGR